MKSAVLTLYSGPLSLYSKKVELALHEKGIAFERIVAPFTQDGGYSPRLPAVVAANPKAQVPVLVDGDLTIWDSTVILEYLEDAHPVPPLFPSSAVERARCRILDVFADEVMIVPIRDLMHRTASRPDPARWSAAEERAAKAEATLDGMFADLDGRLSGQTCFCGSLSVADISVFMAVLYALRLGGPPIDRHLELRRWFKELSSRPAFAAILSEVAAADRDLSTPVEGAYRGLS